MMMREKNITESTLRDRALGSWKMPGVFDNVSLQGDEYLILTPARTPDFIDRLIAIPVSCRALFNPV